MISGREFLVLGHRGAAAHAPENTLLSVETALGMGADGVEVDLRVTRDGELAVHHDEDLARTTGRSARLADLRWEEVRTLDAGRGERVPSAREVLALVRGRGLLNLEMKDPECVPPLAGLLRGAAAAGHEPSEVLVSSFDHASLARLRELLPGVPLAPLSAEGNAGLVDLALGLGARFVNLSSRGVTAAFVGRARVAGLGVLVFTVNDPAEAVALSAMGVAGVFSDAPDRVLAALRGG